MTNDKLHFCQFKGKQSVSIIGWDILFLGISQLGIWGVFKDRILNKEVSFLGTSTPSLPPTTEYAGDDTFYAVYLLSVEKTLRIKFPNSKSVADNDESRIGQVKTKGTKLAERFPDGKVKVIQ